jgi:hypothetical protein
MSSILTKMGSLVELLVGCNNKAGMLHLMMLIFSMEKNLTCLRKCRKPILAALPWSLLQLDIEIWSLWEKSLKEEVTLQ